MNPLITTMIGTLMKSIPNGKTINVIRISCHSNSSIKGFGNVKHSLSLFPFPPLPSALVLSLSLSLSSLSGSGMHGRNALAAPRRGRWRNRDPAPRTSAKRPSNAHSLQVRVSKTPAYGGSMLLLQKKKMITHCKFPGWRWWFRPRPP